MKTFYILKAKRWRKERTVNPLISQAKARQHARSDFQTEMVLTGSELRRLRIEKGDSLDLVAKALKMSKRRLYQIECGTYPHFDVPHLYSLGDYYGVSPSAILSVIPDTTFDFLP